jgi:hypothetical protein
MCNYFFNAKLNINTSQCGILKYFLCIFNLNYMYIKLTKRSRIIRTIRVHHKEGRGKVDYYVYETVGGLLENMPNTNVTENLKNAVEGDYILSDNE